MNKRFTLLFTTLILTFSPETGRASETLPPLTDDNPPGTFEELWAGFDPRSEPLDVEILKEWEEDGVVLRVLRYRIGIFKGRKAMMAGVYGFPKNGTDLPGLVNIHGGGQYADYRSVLTNAKRGYATITIAWAGRINSPQHRVSPKEVKLFWEGKTGNPAYRTTTDWGALDAYHAPSRNGLDAFASIRDGSEPWTLDDIPSPRNNSWFLCTLGARRALTFLERQPEVDGNRLGVYGHSMGGKLTVATAAADNRVKAAAPSCGGISDRYNQNPLHHATLGDGTALEHIRCPIIFLNPANDFHGHINNLPEAIDEIGGTEWRVTCSAHLNHQDYPENEVATQLWFDQHLRGKFSFPTTPRTELQLETGDGIPTILVEADRSRLILGIDVYYTQQGKPGKKDMQNRIHQFWHHAPTEVIGDGTWKAQLPVFSSDLPLWVYADVLYLLEEPVSGAGYYYGEYTSNSFNLSSLIEMVPSAQLKAAGVNPALTPSPIIESFEGEWRKEWFRYSRDGWGMRTHKVYHPIWAAPEGAKLSIEVTSQDENTFVLGIDKHAAEIQSPGEHRWHPLLLEPADFKDAEGKPLASWEGIGELRFLPRETLRSSDRKNPTTRQVGAEWKGSPPQFRNLRWIVE